MANVIITKAAREKMVKARAGAITLPTVMGMAFGDGGCDENGNVAAAIEGQTELRHELYRKAVDGYSFIEDTICRYECTLSESELAGVYISEIGLYDEEGDILCMKLVSGIPLVKWMQNVKAGFSLALYAGELVNNCVTDRADLPLSAAQGKVLMDLYTQLYSDKAPISSPFFKGVIKHSGFGSARQQLANVTGDTLYVGNRHTCSNIVFETKDLAITLQSINQALSAVWLDTTAIIKSGLINRLENLTCYRVGKIILFSGRIFFSGVAFNNDVLLSNLPVNCYGAYFTIGSYGVNGETGEVTGFLVDNVITGLGSPSAAREYRFEVVSVIR